MENKIEAASLTAAECAARTGLTVRALRVYEDYGLIAPQRTAGGWRCYGERELIRLNTITLLKTAGLTLAQIRTATNLNEQDPSLQHVLEMQVDAWKSKQAEAARGQAVVEAALKSLQMKQSVSIDDLCNLIRSLEMSDQRPTPPVSGNEAHEILVDPTILDSYVGFYRYGEFGLITVTRDGQRLFGQSANNPLHEYIALSDAEFLASDINAHARFIVDAQGKPTSLVTYHQGVRAISERIEAAVADEIRVKLAAKIQSQQPTPGSDAALRRVLTGIATGKPNYDEMSSVLAQTIRLQLTQLQGLAKFLGPFESLEFQGVGNQGWDVYEVRRKNSVGQWRIALTSDGIIEGAGAVANDPRLLGDSATKPLNDTSQEPDEQQTPAPGSEAAIRRMIDGIRNGDPNYDEMSPLLAQAIRQQMPMLQMIGKRMGAMVAVEYKGSLTRHYDIFDMQREHGSARWRIALDSDGSIAEASAMVTGSSIAGGP